MRMVAGAVLMLAGVIPVTAGTVAQAATWNKNIDTAQGGYMIGGPLLAGGLALLIWGILAEGRGKRE